MVTLSSSESNSDAVEESLLLRAARISLLVAILLLCLKFLAYRLTHSQAILSDALETVANVVASLLALIVLSIAQKPADRDHPYGHGKIEFFSAAFEGGLIIFASIMILIGAVQALLRGGSVAQLGFGVGLTMLGGLINAALGLYLNRVGQRFHSETLLASGRHVLSDFWTSAGVIIGLLLVHWTGLQQFDSLAALVVGLSLGWTGVRLIRKSAGGLLDEEDRGILERISKIVGRERPTGIIQLHHVRVMRSGRFHHIDAHVVVPEFWNIAEAHARASAFEAMIMKAYAQRGELRLHIDPCRRAYCRVCDVLDCQIRQAPFEKKIELTVEELVNPEEPGQFT